VKGHRVVEFIVGLESWIKGYCLCLAALFGALSIVLLWQLWQTRRDVVKSLDALSACPEPDGSERRYGRSVEAMSVLLDAGEKLPQGSRRWWTKFNDAIEKYSSPEFVGGQRREGSLITSPVSELVTLDDVAPSYSFSLFHSFPGVLTSLGLLGTFIALLLGLKGLRMDGQTVKGIEGLISNLSGKFATSITALTLSVLFLLLELGAQYGLRSWRARLVNRLEGLVPYLSPARVMLDVQREAVKQSTALRNISSDVVDKFADVFRDDLSGVFASHLSGSMATQLQTELGPTLSELRGAMTNLTDSVVRLEAGKQESVVGQIKSLTDSLERTMKESLVQMGKEFRQALSGSTQDEFGELAKVVRGSAKMLDDMNGGFVAMQAALQSIVEEARNNTSSQMEAGVEQTRRLNALVEGLMTRLSEAAAQNSQQVAHVLTNVVAGLSERVEKLSSDLMERVSTLTAESQKVSTDTVRRAGEWSAQTSEHINRLLATLQAKATDFERAGEVLAEAQGSLQATLAQNRLALEELGAAASQVRAYTDSLAGLQRGLGEGQEAQKQLAIVAGQSVAQLHEAADRHEQFLSHYRETFERYQGVFVGLDTQLAQVMEKIVDGLQAYNQTVEQNFKAITESANSVMPQMAGVIRQSTEELSEQLDELSDVLEKGATRIAEATGQNLRSSGRE
jgi:archaellum component FlaC